MLALPRLRNDQASIAKHPAKIKILACGRRWGKTVLGGRIVMEVLAQHGHVAWVAPNYKNSRPLWRWCLQVTAPAIKAGRMSLSKSERTIETTGGGFLGLYSGDNIDSIRGEAFHLVVLDEAARLPEDAWTDAIMPTLADYNGDAILISTPKGKNWFWQEWVRGASGQHEQMSWQRSTHDNPLPQIRTAFDKVRERVPENTFRQEWLAEFVEAGTVFRQIREAAIAVPQSAALDDHRYLIGVDLAKSLDWTVITVLDVTTKPVYMVAMDRFNQIDWALQIGRIQAMVERFGPDGIIIDATGVGDPIVEQLRRVLRCRVQGFQFTSMSKAQAVEALSMAFEQGKIKIINDAVLVNELQAYESERLPSGMVRYNAPAGMHDDTVSALMLAWHGVAGERRPLVGAF